MAKTPNAQPVSPQRVDRELAEPTLARPSHDPVDQTETRSPLREAELRDVEVADSDCAGRGADDSFRCPTSAKRPRKRQFAGEFLRSPRSVGAIAPSSSFLAKRMLDESGIETADTIVEFGPGTGSFTEAILSRRKDGSRFVAIEQSPLFVEHLTAEHPELELLHGSAGVAANLLRSVGIAAVDLVVSGLPWAAFEDSLQEAILDQVQVILGPGGRFVTFAYVGPSFLPRGRAFRKRLESRFDRVEPSRMVWRNLPPAFVYRCR